MGDQCLGCQAGGRGECGPSGHFGSFRIALTEFKDWGRKMPSGFESSASNGQTGPLWLPNSDSYMVMLLAALLAAALQDPSVPEFVAARVGSEPIAVRSFSLPASSWS